MTETPAPGRRLNATLFIFVTVVLDSLALGLIVPVLPKLIGTLQGGGMGLTALIFGAFATVFAVMQFIASPIQGALSDRFGRRPIVLASNVGLGLDYLIMALAPTWAGCSSVVCFRAWPRAAARRPTPISPTSRRRRGARRALG
jgi:DHA1 family tetracycline resistance protein-like MFS transporter